MASLIIFPGLSVNTQDSIMILLCRVFPFFGTSSSYQWSVPPLKQMPQLTCTTRTLTILFSLYNSKLYPQPNAYMILNMLMEWGMNVLSIGIPRCLSNPYTHTHYGPCKFRVCIVSVFSEPPILTSVWLSVTASL